MEVPLQPIFVLLCSWTKFGFNPCFNGSSSSTLLSDTPISIVYNVSILVLMEVPLQLISRQRDD